MSDVVVSSDYFDPSTGKVIKDKLVYSTGDTIDRSKDLIIEYLNNVKKEIDEIPTDTTVWNGPNQSVQKQKLAKIYKEEVLTVLDKYIAKREKEL